MGAALDVVRVLQRTNENLFRLLLTQPVHQRAKRSGSDQHVPGQIICFQCSQDLLHGQSKPGPPRSPPGVRLPSLLWQGFGVSSDGTLDFGIRVHDDRQQHVQHHQRIDETKRPQPQARHDRAGFLSHFMPHDFSQHHTETRVHRTLEIRELLHRASEQHNSRYRPGHEQSKENQKKMEHINSTNSHSSSQDRQPGLSTERLEHAHRNQEQKNGAQIRHSQLVPQRQLHLIQEGL
mmetsp:Transcript_81551/g.218224  ORF Transcript_81551/g.218224 Transcript_81551/m.218224 type:complete len:235 (+) Transcript_81551:648-1352(+)